MQTIPIYNSKFCILIPTINRADLLKESNRIHGVSSIAFEEGAKWYREQIKSKQ